MSTFCELVCSDLWLCIQHLLWAYALSSGCVFSTPWGLHAPPLCQIGHRVVCRGTGHVLSLRPSPILHLSILFITLIQSDDLPCGYGVTVAEIQGEDFDEQ